MVQGERRGDMIRRVSSALRVGAWFGGFYLAQAVSHLLGDSVRIPGRARTVRRNIVYYKGLGFNPYRHLLDLYLPKGRSKFPVLLFIHGGGWRRGHKSLYGLIGSRLAQEGIGVVIANYRLTDGTPNGVTHPGHVEDVARAFSWVYKNAAKFGGDRKKIFLSGHSAGGHLVSLLALDPQYLAVHKLSPKVIKGIISISGVYDVRHPYFGRVFGREVRRRADASPMSQIGKHRAPPFCILYAEREFINLGRQAVEFHKALRQQTSAATLVESKERNHITIIARLPLPGDATAQAMVDFVKTQAGI